MEDRKAEILMAAMLLVFVFLISRHAGLMVSGQNVTAGKKQPVVVLDSGHEARILEKSELTEVWRRILIFRLRKR